MKFIILILVILLTDFCVKCASTGKKDVFEQVISGFEEYKKTGKPPSYFESEIKKYNSPNFFHSPIGTFDKDEFCTICALNVDLFIAQRKQGLTDDQFKNELTYFCNLYQAYPERVCEGVVEINLPIFLYIIDHNTDLNGNDVCGITFQYNDCGLSQKYNWTIEIPPGNTVNKLQATGEKSFNILHITDIHYDPRYTTGKTNNCGEPVCCQDDQPDGATPAESCGYWSDYINADIPWRTVTNALEQTKVHEYDYVYFTGDIIPHRIWNTSIEHNTKIIAQVLDAFVEYYKVPVFPSLGNHESHPCDLYSEIKDQSLSTEWLFDLLFQKLSKWLPVDEIKETVLKGGYYTVSPREGLRIIVLNNNVCNSGNWWLLHNPNDPYNQLKWLADVLLAAEKANERVHLLYHMPSGQNECYFVWAREYRKLIDRFANTIAAQFNGHTHRDEFYIYYNRSNSEQPINMAWNGASVVTYDKANPSYKIVTIDKNTFDILDIDQWAYNLTLANLSPSKNPEWYKVYSFKEAYEVKNLQADEIHKLVLRMTQKHEVVDQYYRFKFRNSDVALKEGCDDDCKKDLLCTMVKTQYGDSEMCDKVKKLYDNGTKVKLTVL